MNNSLLLKYHNTEIFVYSNNDFFVDIISKLYVNLVVEPHGIIAFGYKHSICICVDESNVMFTIDNHEKIYGNKIGWIKQFDQMIHKTVMNDNQNMLFLHASAVKADDTIFAFCGESGSGKTTCTLHFCLNSKFHFIADDFLPISEGLVYSFAMNIHVKKESLHFFDSTSRKSACEEYRCGIRETSYYFPIKELGINSVENISKEKIVIIFVNYNKINDFVRKVSHIDGFRSLILNTYNNNSISNLIRALNNVFAFYKVHYTSFATLDYSIKQIRESLNCNIKNELK